MTRTEADLRAAFTEPAGIQAAERRLLDALTGDRFVVAAPAARRRPLASRVALGVTAASLTGIGATLAVVLAQTGAAPESGDQPAGGTTASTPRQTATPPARVTNKEAVQTLIGLLPRKGSTSHLEESNSDIGFLGGSIVYDDGHGAAQISVGVTYPYVYDGAMQRQAAGSLCSSQGVTQLHQQCRTLPDGTQVATWKTVYEGTKDWYVTLLDPKGVEIDLIELNAAQDKGASPVTRIDPPFTIEELTTIARSGRWLALAQRATAYEEANPPAPVSTPAHARNAHKTETDN